MEIFLLWFILSLITGYIGGKKGHSSFAFFLLSFILSPLVGLIWAFAVKDITEEVAVKSGALTKCPDCAELVLKEAKICKHCGCKLIPESN